MPRVDLVAARSRPVVVGCSGGADSVALLALAVDAGLAPGRGARRPRTARPDSAADADAVRPPRPTRSGSAGSIERVDVEPGGNLEARARDARYDALERRTATKLGATAMLVGHTADDQAETVLLNLLRGAASAGLAGMAHAPRRHRAAAARRAPRGRARCRRKRGARAWSTIR